MKLPDSVLVGHRDIQIVKLSTNEALTDGIHGNYQSCTGTIQLNTTLEDNHLREVLLHEILHAIYDIYNIQDEDTEERIVSTYAPAMIKLFMDNKQIYKLLRGNG